MSAPAWTTVNGLQIVTPTPVGDAGQALNANFTFIGNALANLNSTYLTLIGGTMSGDINLGYHNLTGFHNLTGATSQPSSQTFASVLSGHTYTLTLPIAPSSYFQIQFTKSSGDPFPTGGTMPASGVHTFSGTSPTYSYTVDVGNNAITLTTCPAGFTGMIVTYVGEVSSNVSATGITAGNLTTQFFYAGVNGLYSLYNTLDDGGGNMTVSGAFQNPAILTGQNGYATSATLGDYNYVNNGTYVAVTDENENITLQTNTGDFGSVTINAITTTISGNVSVNANNVDNSYSNGGQFTLNGANIYMINDNYDTLPGSGAGDIFMDDGRINFYGEHTGLYDEGSGLQTYNNTLDDGYGNMNIGAEEGGSITWNTTLSRPNIPSIYSNGNGLQLGDGLGFISFDGNGNIYTNNNTLDSGGNMVAYGSMTSSGFYLNSYEIGYLLGGSIPDSSGLPIIDVGLNAFQFGAPNTGYNGSLFRLDNRGIYPFFQVLYQPKGYNSVTYEKCPLSINNPGTNTMPSVLIGWPTDGENSGYGTGENLQVYGTAKASTFTATTGFSGSGASLTSLNATNISSGTLNNSRLPAAVSVTTLAGAYINTVATKTSAYTLTTSDSVILVNSASNIVMTLPSASTALAGREYTIKTINSAATVKTSASGQKIDGTDYSSTGLSLSANNKYITIVSDGSTNWYIVASN